MSRSGNASIASERNYRQKKKHRSDFWQPKRRTSAEVKAANQKHRYLYKVEAVVKGKPVLLYRWAAGEEALNRMIIQAYARWQGVDYWQAEKESAEITWEKTICLGKMTDRGYM
jgi:hypothetical protein